MHLSVGHIIGQTERGPALMQAVIVENSNILSVFRIYILLSRIDSTITKPINIKTCSFEEVGIRSSVIKICGAIIGIVKVMYLDFGFLLSLLKIMHANVLERRKEHRDLPSKTNAKQLIV